MKEMVILVDENDKEIGIAEKLNAHNRGILHRAFSIFIFNSEGKMLIHRRAKSKYHSGGLWSNACCSHPRPGEDMESAVHRRLSEELGFDTELKKNFDFVYKVKLENELTEHEFDHVFVGKYDGIVNFDRDEVEEIQWIDVQNLKKDIANNPEKYTEWFKIALGRMFARE